ncbi:MAG: methylmalonyl Co-A mutase-associated GTPase MeaB [Immundisolibacterales bacterium]|nr:methylmalonyl Co-A mutase-associated GTPase MeaB [Immundisolibacterales bacterium]
MQHRPRENPSAAALAARVRSGEIRALAKAITLAESTRPADRAAALDLLEALRPPGGTLRIGISGSPGVGKSTFIEAFGLHALGSGHRIAVLTVDPSSQLAGGSILGDKTRMAELSHHPHAYIRPSPAGRTLGGVARRTREAIVLCEAAGFDVVVVETVGVGQSETAVAGMTDVFVLLLAPLAGDELQGIKRGVMELADLVLVNKADGAQADAARRTVAEYRNALHLMRPRTPAWTPKVEACSALAGTGIAEVWREVAGCRTALEASGDWTARRSAQAKEWLREEIEAGVHECLRADPRLTALAAELDEEVEAGRAAPPAAARRLLDAFLTPLRRAPPTPSGRSRP